MNTVTYHLDDTYCPKKHKWTFVSSSLLYSDCYYCPVCDKIWEPTVKEVPKKWFEENFSTDRFGDIKRLAERIEAMKKVTKDDLVKLGYLKAEQE